MDFIINRGRHLLAGRFALICRWWIRGKITGELGTTHRVIELFIPWWGWPLELLHRMVFSKVKIVGGGFHRARLTDQRAGADER